MASEAVNESTARNAASYHGGTNRGLQSGQIFGDVNLNSTNTSEDRALAFVRALPSGYRQHKDVNPPRAPNTCQWCLTDERFSRWRESRDACLLHVLASPGCGKSVLARALIDESMVANQQTSATLYFFFKNGKLNSERAYSVPSVLIHQLYKQHPDHVIRTLSQPHFDAHGDQLAQLFDELWDVFLEICENIGGNITCIIDAVDECCEKDRIDFITKISQFYNSTKTSLIKLKFLMTSRPYTDINFNSGMQFTELPNILRLNSDENPDLLSREINTAVESMVRKALSRASRSIQDAIIEYLQRTKYHTYLWLDLSLKQVSKNSVGHCTETKMKKILDELQLPPTIDKVYEETLNRSPNLNLTRKLLSILLVANYALTPRDLKYAAELLDHDFRMVSYHELDTEPDDIFEENLKDLCGLLIRVHNGRIYFLHETVREYLSDFSESPDQIPVGWRHSINIEAANFDITRACLRFLELREFQAGSEQFFEHNDFAGFVWCRYYGELIEDHSGFLHYAIAQWPKHYLNSGIHKAELFSLALSLIQKVEIEVPFWFAVYCIRIHLEFIPTLTYLVENGLVDLIGYKLVNENSNQHDLLHALKAAARVNHNEIVHMILNYLKDHGPHDNMEAQMTYKAIEKKVLRTAVLANNSSMVKIITDFLKADGQPIFLELGLFEDAVIKGNDTITRLLLELPLINLDPGFFIDPLWRCFAEGKSKLSAVRMLLDYKIRTSGLSVSTWRAILTKLVEKIDIEGAKFLLEDYPQYSVETCAIIAYNAVELSDQSIVSFLVKYHATAFSAALFSDLLQRAVTHEDEQVVALLLQFDRDDINGQSVHFQRAFDIATAQRSDTIIQMILMDGRLGYYSGLDHALHVAASEARLDMATHIINHCTRNSTELNDDVYLAVEEVAGKGHQDVLELLVRYCATVKPLPEYCYRAALHKAAENNHGDAVQFLLDHGPEDLKDQYRTIYDDSSEPLISTADSRRSPSMDIDSEGFDLGSGFDSENSD